MNTKHEVTNLDQPDPSLLDHVLMIQKGCLGVAVILAVIGLLNWAIPAATGLLPAGAVMSVGAALVSMACAASLALSVASPARQLHTLGRWVAGGATALGLATLIGPAGGASAWPQLMSVADRPSTQPGEMTVQFAATFVLLAVLLLFIGARRGLISHATDVLTGMLCLLLSFLVSRYIFEVTVVFAAPFRDPTPPATLTALGLLIFAAVLLRTQHGVFKILLGSGLGGRLARGLTPILILLPFIREAGRERIVHTRLVPEHGAAALLASIAAILALGFLFLVAHYIHRMEKDIRDLSLRDELTGLYNLRGFQFLAEQALRLAQRSQVPFSVVFIDVDDLKQVNDSLGHGVGSAFLAETADLLKANFRETDVIGRIGGDEFAVAGQFSRDAIVEATARLQQQASRNRNEIPGRLSISLSIGHITTDGGAHETLQQLLDKADAVMYDQKRRKKLQLC